MKKISFVSLIFIFFITVTLYAEPSAAVGKKRAPDFTVTFADGSKRTLADYSGKVLLLHFWATWCPPCIRELPKLDVLAKKTEASKNFSFLAVCVSDTEVSRTSFMKKNNYSFTGVLDANGSVASAYGIQAIPASFIISADGIILESYVGEMPESKIAELETRYGSN